MMNCDAFHIYEAAFLRNASESHRLLPGEGPVMLSSPHSVAQWRNGADKVAEPQTGALACLLSEDLGCPAMVKTACCRDDANYDPVSPYKEDLVAYVKEKGIRFLIDLHQLASFREEGINLGTAGMKNLSEPRYLALAQEAFASQGLGPVTVDTPFGAFYPYTVSSYLADACGISCLQIEINSSLLRGEGSRPERVYEALADLIRRSALL